MKGVWIDSALLQRGDISPQAKILAGWIYSLGTRGLALHLPLDELASSLGATRSAVRSALYELECAKLIGSTEQGYVTAAMMRKDQSEPVRFKVPAGYVVLSVGRDSTLIARDDNPRVVVQVRGVPDDADTDNGDLDALTDDEYEKLSDEIAEETWQVAMDFLAGLREDQEQNLSDSNGKGNSVAG